MTILLLAAAAAPLAASGAWNVHEEESYCILSRSYGTGRDRVEIGFQPSIGGKSLTIAVLTPARGGGQEVGAARIVRQPDGRTFEGYAYSIPIANKLRLTQISASGELFTELGDSKVLRIRAAPVNVAVAIPPSGKAMAAFRQCEDGLLESWGIRPAAFRAGRGPEPSRDVQKFFRAADYPAVALAGRYIGQVRAALVVGADGVVKDCRIVTHIGAAFDQVTCAQARKIPFSPGLDETGGPTQSLFNLNVRWEIGS